MKLVKDGMIFGTDNADLITAYKEAGYVELKEEEIKAPTKKAVKTKE